MITKLKNKKFNTSKMIKIKIIQKCINNFLKLFLMT